MFDKILLGGYPPFVAFDCRLFDQRLLGHGANRILFVFFTTEFHILRRGVSNHEALTFKLLEDWRRVIKEKTGPYTKVDIMLFHGLSK